MKLPYLGLSLSLVASAVAADCYPGSDASVQNAAAKSPPPTICPEVLQHVFFIHVGDQQFQFSAIASDGGDLCAVSKILAFG